MPSQYVRRGTDLAPNQTNRKSSNAIFVDSDTNELKVGTGDSGTSVNTVVDTTTAQTLTSKTLTSPTITGGTISGTPTGAVRIAGGTITELDGDGAYSISVTLPAGSQLLNFIVTQKALWTAGTSATLIVGDTADPDGFITGVNAKTTPAVGTSITPDTVPAGAVDGAYLGDTNGEFVAPASSNFGRFYEAGSVITATITKAGTGTAGRTNFQVVYAVPETIAQVVV